MTRDELLEPIVRSIRSGTNIPGPTIRRYFEDWDLEPVYVDGQHVGTAVVKGTEIHFALTPGWRPRSSYRGAIRSFLAPLLERRGFLTTRLLHEHADQKRFVQRLGFKPTWRDDRFEYFLLAAVPFERKTDAQ